MLLKYALVKRSPIPTVLYLKGSLTNLFVFVYVSDTISKLNVSNCCTQERANHHIL